MEIKTSLTNTNVDAGQSTKGQPQTSTDTKFSDELKELDKTKAEKEVLTDKNNEEVTEASQDELKNSAAKLNQSEDSEWKNIKDIRDLSDIKSTGTDMIDNDFNIDNRDKLPQMMPNMNFGGDGQPFSSFMNNGGNENYQELLSSSAKELAEEAAILSTMAENLSIAKINQEGIKKVNAKTNMVEDIIVNYDTVIMNEADAGMFADLVNGKEINLNNLTDNSVHKSVGVSKTLADLLAKSMQDNKPVRIEFDNGISVIIKISKDGKLSADFLPSTQVAEAYLKENLPLLKQRFNEQNLEYGELNQRERRERNRDQDRKKGRENE